MSRATTLYIRHLKNAALSACFSKLYLSTDRHKTVSYYRHGKPSQSERHDEKLASSIQILLLLLGLSGCCGTKVLKEPEPLEAGVPVLSN